MSEKRTQTDILNELFTEYGLVYDPNNKKDSDVFITKNFKIITRAGIQKIQAKIGIESTYEVAFIDPFSVVLKGKFSYMQGGERISTETFGEASVDRVSFVTETKTSKKPDGSEMMAQDVVKLIQVPGNVQGNPPYLAAMAEKRALSRGVLQLAGLYKHGVFGEDEADAFAKEVKQQVSE